MQDNMQSNKKESTLKGLRIRTLSSWMVACTILISLLIAVGIAHVMNEYNDFSSMTKEYILAQDSVTDMSLGFAYLTEEARLYVVTTDYSHADAYFTELEETRRKENALQEMAYHLESEDETSLQLLDEVLALSDQLMDMEIHSMKLAALSANVDLKEFSPKIQDYPLSEEELLYSPNQMSDVAYQLTFGPEYHEMQKQLKEKLTSITEQVISACSYRQAESEQAMKRALIRQLFYSILIVILVITAYVLISILILRPIRLYINNIEQNRSLEMTGAYEFKYLAATYNSIYETALENQNLLRKKAENDTLTGLLNREAFEQLKTRFKNAPMPIALILLDVDIFKSINDTYGHATGDKALIKTAHILKCNFRSNDHVFRIGGDEFAIVMEKISPEKKEIIKCKIDRINQELLHPQDNLPAYSLSVGVAFSENGYHDELFGYADHALYATKNNGRCGCTFYNS